VTPNVALIFRICQPAPSAVGGGPAGGTPPSRGSGSGGAGAGRRDHRVLVIEEAEGRKISLATVADEEADADIAES
jgi:hypothetical protein